LSQDKSAVSYKILKKGGKNMKEVGRYDTAMQMFVQKARETDLGRAKFMRWLAENHRLEQPQAGPAGGYLALAAGLDDSENNRRKAILTIQTDMTKNSTLVKDIDQVLEKMGEDPTSEKLSSLQKEPVTEKANQVRRDPYDSSLQMFVRTERDLDPKHLRFYRWLAENGRLEHPVVGS
jgi:hypothetical protein